MKLRVFCRNLLRGLAAIAMLYGASCGAQPYPMKPVRVIVPFAPGGGGDITARLVSAKLAERLKQQFVVDNRGGAGGLIGVELAVKAAPDGYTIIIVSSSFSATSATHKPAFDPVNNVAPIGEIGIAPFVLSVHPSVSAKSAQDLFALARSKPGTPVYGIPGIGSITHLATELMLHIAGITMTGVPYKGTGPAMVDVISGQCQLILGSLPPLAPHFVTGKLRPLAVTSTERWYSVPNLPTLGESLPGYAVENWWGMMAPKGTPKLIIERLNVVLNQLLQDADMKASLDKEGVVPSGGTAARFGERTREEYDKWLKVVAASEHPGTGRINHHDNADEKHFEHPACAGRVFRWRAHWLVSGQRGAKGQGIAALRDRGWRHLGQRACATAGRYRFEV